MYFNIQRFSTHDGDGIRTILFLKGCSLSCRWCQNPESHSEKRSLLFDQRVCLDDCELCTQVCHGIQKRNNEIIIDRKIISEEDLISLHNVCPSQALTVSGQEADSEELFQLLMRDLPFYQQSNGGVTFSGGEPLMQPNLVANIAQKLRQQSVNTAIETCMHVPWKNIEKNVPFIDCWLGDLKHTDSKKFLEWTNGSAKRIMHNYRKLAPLAKRIIIRVPVIPGFNDTDQELQDIIDFAASLESCTELHLLPYHTLGINKYSLLDMPYLCSEQPLNNPELLNRAEEYASKHTQLNVTIRG